MKYFVTIEGDIIWVTRVRGLCKGKFCHSTIYSVKYIRTAALKSVSFAVCRRQVGRIAGQGTGRDNLPGGGCKVAGDAWSLEHVSLGSNPKEDGEFLEERWTASEAMVGGHHSRMILR